MDDTTSHRLPRGFEDHEGDRQFATTLARGLELLRCFTPDTQVLGNRDLCLATGLPAPTVSRLTYTLACMGYLAPAHSYGKYRLGATVLSLGYPLLELFAFRRRARDAMMELAREIGGSVSIGIRDRLSIVYIESFRYSGRRPYPINIGATHSLAGTAVGRACLLSHSLAERTALLNQLRVKEPGEWARYHEQLLRNLEEYPRRGFCVSLGEVYPEVQGIAVPLGRIDEQEPAALNCAFSGRPIDERWLTEQIAPKLLALVQRLK